MKYINESVIVACDFSVTDRGVLIIGKQDNKGKITIINAYQDKEAWDLWQKLTTRKEIAND